MHTLMSFIGCVDILMANTGLEEITSKAFPDVKKFPQNMRALRMVAEECIRAASVTYSNDNLDLIEVLKQRSKLSLTSKLWLDCLIKPVLIMMAFVHAERGGDWPLHIYATSQMIPYFAAAAHWNYFRYGIVYLIKMSNMPEEVLSEFMK